MIIISVVCTISALFLGYHLFPEEWSIIRKILAGIFSGLGVALLIIATRLVKTAGNDSYDREN